jgi:stalled ribosome alternative rescue factor ArfA|tara:strand:+ start:31479 stop:32057 length:579 start_codon:yes stop_codon:yes gene_type:complete
MQNDHLFFPHQEGDDLEDRYEELLFEDKQFFTTRAIVPKVFRARIEKMKKREEAFRRLTSIKERENIELVPLKFESTADIHQNYLNFQKDRALVMQQLYRTQECNSVIRLIEQLVHRYIAYLLPWQLVKVEEVEGIIISKEPDPTELYNALKAFSDEGGKNVNEIQSLFFNGKVLLENEAKRLSLLLQNENQ